MQPKKVVKKKKPSPEKNVNREIHHRLNTFNSSEFSMLEDKNYVSASVCDLFRNDVIRNRKTYNASVSSKGKISHLKPMKQKSTKLIVSKPKKHDEQINLKSSKSHLLIPNSVDRIHLIQNRKMNNVSSSSNRPIKKKNVKPTKPNTKQKNKKITQQQYQHIYLNPSNSQSEIVFSNQDTKRKTSQVKVKNDLIINSHLEYELKMNDVFPKKKKEERTQSQYPRSDFSNNMLRLSIKRQYQRKVEAVIKIQKVYRGYATRKLLDKYIKNESVQLMQRLAQIQQFQSRRNQQRKVNLESFSSVNQQSSSSNLKTFEDIQKSNQSLNKLSPSEFGVTKKQFTNNDFKIQIDKSFQEGQNDSNSDDDDDVIAYRHQQPIYSHQQISKYLDSSEQEEQEDQVYQPQVIFETNQEYIQSRKSSLQNKNQPRIHFVSYVNEKTDNDREQNSQILNTQATRFQTIPNNLPTEQDEEPTKTKQVFDETFEFKGQNLKKLNLNFSKDEANQLSKLKKSRNISNSSSSSLKKNNQSHLQDDKIKMLKENEKQKWQQVIQMVSKQVKENQQKNTEMAHFMKCIIQISKRNKDFLNTNEDFQGYATPTTIDKKMESIDFEDHNNAPEIQPLPYKFQKKKNLQIEIIQDSKSSHQHPGMCSKFKDSTNNTFKKQLRKQLKSPKNFTNTNELANLANQTNTQNQQNLVHQQNINHEIRNDSKSSSENLSVSLKNQTAKLRHFLTENIQNQSIESMFKVREQLLQKRESQMLIKLNNQLSKKQLSQDQFLSKLQQLTQKFHKQKQSIDKARKDIEKGYQAAVGLVKQAYNDAKKLGIKIPLSRSLGNIKYKPNPGLLFQNVIVDQFQCYTPKGIINVGLKSTAYPNNPKSVRPDLVQVESQSGSQLDFTEEELNRFRKMKHYDSDFIQMNKNITITSDFLKKHLVDEHKKNQCTPTSQFSDKSVDFNLKINSEAYRQRYQVQESTPIKSNLQIDYLANRQIQFIIYQCVFEILLKPTLSERLIDRSRLSRPKKILKEQQILFIQLLQQLLVNKNELLQKLNQKITPLPSQLLKCMRIDFSDQNEDDDNQYEEIGKYEFIISQDICSKAVHIFKQKITPINQSPKASLIKSPNINFPNYDKFQTLQSQYKFQDKIVKYVHQKDKFIKQRKQHTYGLRWEVLNIQVHCIFDSWNQHLIQLRTRKPGFSGTGLNQLTLSTMDQNHPISLKEVQPLVNLAKTKLLEILNDDSDPMQKMQRQNFEQMCFNDSSWIYYADEALSYGLELGYLVEEQIFAELANEIMSYFTKGSGSGIIFKDLSSDDEYFCNNVDSFFTQRQ